MSPGSGPECVVISVGTSCLAPGGELDGAAFAALADDVVRMRAQGIQPVIVSAGADAVGAARLAATGRGPTGPGRPCRRPWRRTGPADRRGRRAGAPVRGVPRCSGGARAGGGPRPADGGRRDGARTPKRCPVRPAGRARCRTGAGRQRERRRPGPRRRGARRVARRLVAGPSAAAPDRRAGFRRSGAPSVGPARRRLEVAVIAPGPGGLPERGFPGRAAACPPCCAPPGSPPWQGCPW